MSVKSSLARKMLQIAKIAEWTSRLSGQLSLLEDQRISPFILHERIENISSELTIFDATPIGYIRLGDAGDGGYVVADCIRDNIGVLSLGVGDNVSFDLAISKYIRNIHLYDHTVNGLPISIPNSTFYREGLGNNDGFTSLNAAVARFENNQDLILKMDIESAEWEIICSMGVDLLNRFSQIIIEFHGLARIVDEVLFQEMLTSFRNLNSTHYLINTHANNYEPVKILGGFPLPNVIECTYLRKNEGTLIPIQNRLTHNLNKPNNGRNPESRSGFIY